MEQSDIDFLRLTFESQEKIYHKEMVKLADRILKKGITTSTYLLRSWGYIEAYGWGETAFWKIGKKIRRSADEVSWLFLEKLKKGGVNKDFAICFFVKYGYQQVEIKNIVNDLVKSKKVIFDKQNDRFTVYV